MSLLRKIVPEDNGKVRMDIDGETHRENLPSEIDGNNVDQVFEYLVYRIQKEMSNNPGAKTYEIVYVGQNHTREVSLSGK